MKKTKMLKKNYEFKNVFSKGKYYSGKYVEAFIRDNGNDFNLLGLAISVKTAKAVRRNKIKRLLREAYKINEPDIGLGKSMVFLWKKNANVKNATFDNVFSDVSSIFEKADLKVKKM